MQRMVMTVRRVTSRCLNQLIKPCLWLSGTSTTIQRPSQFLFHIQMILEIRFGELIWLAWSPGCLQQGSSMIPLIGSALNSPSIPAIVARRMASLGLFQKDEMLLCISNHLSSAARGPFMHWTAPTEESVAAYHILGCMTACGGFPAPW